MSLSQPQCTFNLSQSQRNCTQQVHEHDREIKPFVELSLNLSVVTMLTLCEVKRMVRPSDGRFKTLYRCHSKRLHVLEHYNRVVVGCRLHRSDRRNFVLRSPARLATGVLATKTGITHLRPSIEHLVRFTVAYDLGEFVHTKPHPVNIQHEFFVELPIGSEFVYNALNCFGVNDKQGEVAPRCLESVSAKSVLDFDALTGSMDNRVTWRMFRVATPWMKWPNLPQRRQPTRDIVYSLPFAAVMSTLRGTYCSSQIAINTLSCDWSHCPSVNNCQLN